MALIPGHATETGTARFAQRFPAAAADHFRQRYGLWMSSLGLGTQIGAPTDEISRAYAAAIPAALGAGCNVIDTAPNYRLGRAERDVGAALAHAIGQGIVSRDELIICTKAGYVPMDWPESDRPGDTVAGIHSLDPAFLSAQIDASRARLGLEVIDLLYVQNPDIRLFFENPGTFMQRMTGAFEALEERVSAGTIRFYGVAADEGFLADPTAENFLPFYKLVQIAEAVAGANHRFRFVQFPYHMGLNSGLNTSNQPMQHREGDVVRRTQMPILAAAMQHGVTAITCGGIFQGLLAEELPDGLGKTWGRRMGKIHGQRPTPAQAALHFNRSTPGVTTTLFSSTDVAHVAENLALCPLEPWGAEPFLRFLGG